MFRWASYLDEQLNDMKMRFEIVQTSVLKIFKVPINELAGLADHYYLSDCVGSNNVLSWDTHGLDLQGTVRLTYQELERIEQFMLIAPYSIATNNCEHFANYILYGINFSSQQQVWWKCLGAEAVRHLQLVQSVRSNFNNYIGQQVSEAIKEDLRRSKIERANQERIDFWRARGVEVKQ